jgi:signal transduction histidine kinase
LMRQVILNLTSNAIKYTPPDGRIEIRMGTRERALYWSIRDSGIGISPTAQKRLFEKFYRADNAHTVDTEGTGLGLYLVRLIIERLGGTIGCESEEGRGTLFYFTLPIPAGDPI